MSTEARVLIVAPVSVRWGDMDAFGHVNNSVFATYLEEARLRWFATFEGGWHDETAAPVVAAQSFNFRQPIEWPAELLVELMLERSGTSSMTLGFRMVSREAPQRFYADGSIVLVWIDRGTGKSTPLPPSVRAAIAR
jgi:acyl-CoA thioester hydrolase